MTDQADLELDAKLARLMGWTELEPTFSTKGEALEWKGVPGHFFSKPTPPLPDDPARRGLGLDGAKLFAGLPGGLVYVAHCSTRIEHAFAAYGPVEHMRSLDWRWSHREGSRSVVWGLHAPPTSSLLDDPELWARMVRDKPLFKGAAPLGDDPLAITRAAVEALERIARPSAGSGAEAEELSGAPQETRTESVATSDLERVVHRRAANISRGNEPGDAALQARGRGDCRVTTLGHDRRQKPPPDTAGGA